MTERFDYLNASDEEIAKIPYKEVLKTHIRVFGETLARAGMVEDFVYDQDYLMHLISNEGFRWLIDSYCRDLDTATPVILDRLDKEYNHYLDWVEAKRALKNNK